MAPSQFHQEDIEERAGTIRLPEYEAALDDAHSRADNERLAEVSAEYHDKRMALAEARMRKEAGLAEEEEDPRPDRTWSRPDIEDYAKDHGVDDPESYGNKQELLDAIEEAR